MDPSMQGSLVEVQRLLAEIERLPATSPARTEQARALVRAWVRAPTADSRGVEEVGRWVAALAEQPSSHARFDLASARLASALRDVLGSS